MKRKCILTWLALIFLVCAVTGIVACGGKKILNTPVNLTLGDDEILRWDAVPHANGYEVEINGKIYSTETNSLDTFLITDKPAEYEMCVAATGGGKYLPSDLSQAVIYTVNDYMDDALIETNDKSKTFRIRGFENPQRIRGKLVLPEYLANGYSLNNINIKDCGKFLTSVILPDSLELAPGFKDFKKLNRVRLSNATSSLIDDFSGCESLQEIVLPESLLTMTVDTFRNCKSLKELTIPRKVKQIMGCITGGCTSLEKLEVDPENEVFYSENNSIFRRDDNELVSGNSEGYISEKMHTLNRNVFCGQTFTHIEIPGNIKKIGDLAFANCDNLESVKLNEGVEYIGRAYLRGKEIHIPASVREMTSASFSHNAQKVTVSENNQVYKSDNNCIIERATGKLILGCDATSVIPDYVTEIAAGAFSGCGFEHIEIPGSVKAIGDNAFGGCKKLQYITIPKGTSGDHASFWAGTVVTADSSFKFKLEQVNFKDYPAMFNYGEANSVLKYDGEYPYVYSYTLYGKFVAAPYRKEYTFAGWTTEEGSGRVDFSAELYEGTLEYDIVNLASLGRDSKKYNGFTVKGTIFSPEMFEYETTLYAVWIKD